MALPESAANSSLLLREVVMPTLLKSPVGLTRLRELCDTLEDNERTLRDFFDLSPDLLAVISVDGYFLQSNPSWRKLLGWSDEELGEISWLSLIHPDDQSGLREAIGHLVACDVHRLVCRVRCANEQYKVVEFSATRWRRGSSNLVGRVVPDACLACPETSLRLNRRTYDTNYQ
jgi:PAS domain S-box-containing protein